MRSLLALLALLNGLAVADVYFHTMRGSNNRLNEASNNVQNQQRLFNSQNNNNGGYAWGPPMVYYAGSQLNLEWTNQHSCGTGNANCNLVLQYMCDSTLRDGDPTQTQGLQTINVGQSDSSQLAYGRHESIDYYNLCAQRTRNTRLFTADQTLNGNTARFTRQQPGGTQYGTECPEERDYYPYWAWTPWKDIAVITDNTTLCPLYQSQSQNVASRGNCSNPTFNNQFDCSASGAQWSTVPGWGIAAPACVQASWTRDNHLGNTLTGQMFNYNWTVPSEMIGQTCALRIRYNISTGDYDGWNIDASNNTNNSPIQDNPTVNIGAVTPLTLNINTNQFGRTFQDRSFQFTVLKRPSSVPDSAAIYNLNVRGKRGNIVQVYPSVEYDYVPNRLHITSNDYVHVQWTGSDFNPTNNEGNGTPGTDRSNIVEILGWGKNIPINISASGSLMGSKTFTQMLATLGQTDPDLNNAPTPYFNGGLIQMSPGTFYYMCTRNNDFSNRSQKGAIFVAKGSFGVKLVVSWVLLLLGLVIAL